VVRSPAETKTLVCVRVAWADGAPGIGLAVNADAGTVLVDGGGRGPREPAGRKGKMPLTEALIDAVPGPALVKVLAPIASALVYISRSSLLGEPARQNFNAVFLAGAGAAYLSGGLRRVGVRLHRPGYPLRLHGAVVVRFCRRRMASAHRLGRVAPPLRDPIVPFAPDSSLGCAICDPVIALWLFAGAPSVYGALRRETGRKTG
jgi:Family of unknown function (DUF6010)